jgi:phage gp16-like protein
MVIDTRKRDLALIHIAKKQTDIAEETYRAKLQEIGGVSSSSDLDQKGRAAILAYFNTIGFKPTGTKGGAKRPKRPTPAPENAALCRKIRAQLISLGRLPDTYADGIAKQAFTVDFYEWCTPEQLRKISTMLAAEQKRKGAATAPRKP